MRDGPGGYVQGAECDTVAIQAAGFVKQRTPKPRVDFSYLIRHQGGNLIMKGGNWEREGGDLWDLVFTKVLVKTEVCQVRDEEGIFLVPPEVSADRVGMCDETANLV